MKIIVAALSFALILSSTDANAAAGCRDINKAIKEQNRIILVKERKRAGAEKQLHNIDRHLQKLQERFDPLAPYCTEAAEIPVPADVAKAQEICSAPESDTTDIKAQRTACRAAGKYERSLGKSRRRCERLKKKITVFDNGSRGIKAILLRESIAEIETEITAAQAAKLQKESELEVCQSNSNNEGAANSNNGSDNPDKLNILINFDDQPLGTQYPVGQGFSAGPVSALVGHFTWRNGESTAQYEQARFASIEPNWFTPYPAGGANPDDPGTRTLYPGNATVNFTLPSCATRVAFDYWDGGGNINLLINGELQVVEDLSELNRSSVGSTDISVVKMDVDLQDAGTVAITGRCISSFGLGGQEALFDNIHITD